MIGTTYRAVAVICLATTYASAQSVTCVSVDPYGGGSNGASFSRSVSDDGRYVAFASDATNLVASDGNGVSDVFVRDRVTGVTVRASVDSHGVEGNGASTMPAISADGRYVAFASFATNLVTGDNNGRQDVFLHDVQNGTTVRVSVTSSGGEAHGGDSMGPWLSGDGSVVVFASSATDLVTNDTNSLQDIFVRDTSAGTTTRVSVSSSGTQANGKSIRPTISRDGMKVAFASTASNLVSGDGNNKADVFVHDRSNATTIRASVSNGGSGGNNTSSEPEISGDGTVVVFDSTSTNLVSGDTNGKNDVFMRDLVNNTTTRLSVSSSGAEGDGDSFDPSVSKDGSVVVFASGATNLDANPDTNGVADIYARYLHLDETRRLSLGPAGAEPDSACTDAEISGDGYVVSFQSAATNLVSGDTNGVSDVFAHSTCEVRFAEFGVGLAGSGGYVPHLAGHGGMCIGDYSLDITNGVGFAPGYLWLAFATADYYPVFGGHFYLDLSLGYIPLPILLGGAVGAPGQGSLTIDGDDISGNDGITVYMQVTLIDSQAIRGVSLSNALQMDLVGR